MHRAEHRDSLHVGKSPLRSLRCGLRVRSAGFVGIFKPPTRRHASGADLSCHFAGLRAREWPTTCPATPPPKKAPESPTPNGIRCPFLTRAEAVAWPSNSAEMRQARRDEKSVPGE